MRFKEFLTESVDWMIQVIRNGEPFYVHFDKSGGIVRPVLLRQTPANHLHCSKWRVKERAEKALRTLQTFAPDAQLIDTYGGPPIGGKDAAWHRPTRRPEHKN